MNDWFSIDRMLPDYGREVLLYFPNGRIDVGSRVSTADCEDEDLRNTVVWNANMCGYIFEDNGLIRPTHWRCLPQPPDYKQA